MIAKDDLSLADRAVGTALVGNHCCGDEGWSSGGEKHGPAQSFAAAKNAHLSFWLVHPMNWSDCQMQMGHGQMAPVCVKQLQPHTSCRGELIGCCSSL